MTIKFRLAAIAAMFSMMLIFAPSTQAKEAPKTKQTKTAPVHVVVQPGDTLTSIADAHKTTYVRIFNANTAIANPDVINVGDKLRIPTKDEELRDRLSEIAVAQPAPVAPQVPVTTEQYAPVAATVAQPVYASSAGNTYYAGYCTWYAKERRPDLPNMLGNGGQWVANAAAQGFATGSAPRVGAIAESPGHVAYVESVNGNGTITISEMNGVAGFGNVGSRTVPASQYSYIY